MALKSLAISRLGKDVVDLLDVSVSYGNKKVLDQVEWLIAPGERTGILGANGAGKTTLLALINGSLSPTTGRVRRGKTVRVATLSQRLDEPDEYADEPVRVVLGRLRTTYSVGSGSKTQELTPVQLLERLGFSSAQLSTTVADLSGGQRRRLQLLLLLLDQPNVLILDEPTNDLDTDMLGALEDLLDSWAGCLIVVSHDRYFIERVTDQQYALYDGHLRHLPGGVDEYLALPRASLTGTQSTDARPERPADTAVSGLSGARLRALTKKLASVERKMERVGGQIADIHQRMACHDPSDYAGLVALDAELRAAEAENLALEERWLALGEQIG